MNKAQRRQLKRNRAKRVEEYRKNSWFINKGEYFARKAGWRFNVQAPTRQFNLNK